MESKYSRKDLMNLAMEEFYKCSGFPRVGAVIAKGGVLLSTGYRGEKGDLHAERVAIEKLAPDQLAGSTLFTTLEPCVQVYPGQMVESCAELILKSGIKEIVIGALDANNGNVYSKGYGALVAGKARVYFFSKDLKATLEEDTFKVGDIHTLIGRGKRRIPLVHSGISLEVRFSETDPRVIHTRWNTLQADLSSVDLLSDNGAVRVASGATNFEDITDPMVFKFESHVARMKRGMIAIVNPAGSTFCVLIKLLEIYQNSISFQFETRNNI